MRKLTVEDVERGRRIPDDECPRRYCFFWGYMSFAWDLSPVDGCRYDGPRMPEEFPDREVPCCRAVPSSGADHYEPDDATLIKDNVTPDRWLQWKRPRRHKRSP